MEAKTKNYLIGTTLGVLLALGVYKLYLKDSPKDKASVPVTSENIETAIQAYREALADRSTTKQDLEELNKLSMQEFGVKVYQRKDGRLSVTNNAGKEIKVVSL